MAEQTLRDALKELRAYCGRHVDDPRASEDEQVAYDDVCIQLAQILQRHPAAPAGDGGLREALEQKLATTDGWAVANETLLDMLRAHPAEPTPTREQIVQALHDALTPWRSERSSLDSLAQPLADAVLAVLAGEQEQP